MQYASAVALASLSGKPPSTHRPTQPRTQSSPSSRLPASPSMRHRSPQCSLPLMAEKSKTYRHSHSGH